MSCDKKGQQGNRMALTRGRLRKSLVIGCLVKVGVSSVESASKSGSVIHDA